MELKKKVLIAFYSRNGENYFSGKKKYVETGNTEKVAHFIAEITGGTLFQIRQKHEYSYVYSECIEQAKRDLQNNARPELVPANFDLNLYDEIYLGYPNYWGTMPMAVYSFLENNDFNGKVIHPFCTHEGSGLAGTVSDIQKTVPEATVTDGLAVFGSAADNSKESVERWIYGL